MKIHLGKFGTTLTSRQLGKEALAAFQPLLAEVKQGELIEVDFDGVNTFSPSWGDEFLTPLEEMYPGKVVLLPTKNLSVKVTLEILETTNGKKFKMEG
ncbi:hypothetical protein HZA40_00125 [Candidatus Peregrinibacteria bacterium]|nr:hypothetical protein [Candidatus Peregrinibacteria bacterium]